MEELDLKNILAGLDHYQLTPIERVLAAHTGTVQLLLSLWWNQPVVVKLKGPQSQSADILKREALLLLENSGKEVASAVSIIDLGLNSPKIIEDVLAGKLGIGQIALKHSINTNRRILDVSMKDGCLCRKYIMEGPDLHYEIQEYFPRNLYKQWPA